MKYTVSLKENRDFKRLYYRGKSAVTGVVALYSSPNRLGYNRLGITAGKKIGGAVCRNRAKRLIREGFLPLEGRVKRGTDIVIVARSRILEAKLPDISAAIRLCLKKNEIYLQDQ